MTRRLLGTALIAIALGTASVGSGSGGVVVMLVLLSVEEPVTEEPTPKKGGEGAPARRPY